MNKLLLAFLVFVVTTATAQAHGEVGWMYQSQLEGEGATPVEIHVYYTMDHETDERVLRYVTSMYPLLDEDGAVVPFEQLTPERIETVMTAWLTQQRSDLMQDVEEWEIAKAAEAVEHNEGLGCMEVPVLKPMPETLEHYPDANVPHDEF